jgi:hypothetical protein
VWFIPSNQNSVPRKSLAKVIENHGIDIGRKQIMSLRGGHGVYCRCVSFDEEKMECNEK